MSHILLNEHIVQEVRRDNCFDFLRYFFACFLVLAHFEALTGSELPFFIFGSLRLKAFFIITGFLVSYSFLRRQRPGNYAMKRFVRIVPAYVCAIVLGMVMSTCLSTLPVGEFLTSPHTWRYAAANLLMLGWIEPTLPGVFEGMPFEAVNGALWTMKLEVAFYVAVPLLLWAACRWGRRWTADLLMAVCVVAFAWMPYQLACATFFIGGMFILLHFDAFVRHKRRYALLALVSEAMLYSDVCPALTTLFAALEPLSYTAIILFAAYSLPALNFMRRYDNITYGIFLYHFPVTQACISLGLYRYSPALCFITVVAVTVALAALSWRFVEQPLMNRYK